MASNVPMSPSGWGPVPSTPLLTPVQTTPAMLSNDVSETSFTTHKDDKLPHDASVFVGSLPSNIDQGELTRMLMEHLSEHTQIKNIKVVRDSKGGVCAFVQCENALSATALIQTLHSGVPKPFLGRILRYEPARAFRTLLVSYRMPTKIVRPGGVNNMASYTSEVNLELPHAMRIWKHRNSSILYNSDAIQAEENCDNNASDGCPPENVIFLHPLDFGKESLHTLVAYFGRLERFSPFQLTNVDVDKENGHLDVDGSQGANAPSYLSYPAPHNAPRSLSMDSRCWEVKWEHRDDCVSALMTLRRVPHLTVTWAHQPAPTIQGLTSNYQVHSLPSYSFHAQHRMLPSHTLTSPNGSISSRSHSQPSKTGIEIIDDTVSATVDRVQTLPSELVLGQAPDDPKLTTLTTSTGPPTENTDPKLPLSTIGRQPSWADGDPSSASGLVEDERTTGHATDHQDGPEASQGREITHITEGSKDQELYMPQTPALDKASITPNTPGSHFPLTPTSYAGDDSQEMRYGDFDEKDKITSSKGLRADREIDPTTLFVGGLEMFGPGAWDEEKVKNFFTRFGGLESVKVVRPLNSCAAFAFVKFNNAEAPARAVLEEHNRVYEGRAMRVQLRDCNPPRNIWKYGRGRGRHYQNQYDSQRRSQYRPSYDAHEVHLHNESRHPFQGSDNIPDSQFSSLTATLSSVKLSPSRDNDMGSGSTEPASSSDVSSGARHTALSEKYLEWYDEPDSSTHTPEPSLGSSISVGGPPLSTPPYAYPVPHGQYFPSQPWVQPYLSQTAYQMPYYSGYPIYSPAVQQSPHPGVGSPSGADVNGPGAVAQAGWPQMGVYASYIPYPAVFPLPAVVDQAQVPPVSNQAPLIPTGFIQNEHGTLIPVYQPEALDQYMAGSGGPSAAAPTRHPSSVPPRWNNVSPYPHELSNAQANSFTQHNHGYNRPKTVGIPHSIPQQFSELQQSSSTGHIGDVAANISMPLYRRQGQRRDINQNYNSVRHHGHPRSYNGRLVRGHLHNSGQTQPPDLGNPAAGSALPINNWNKWNGTR